MKVDFITKDDMLGVEQKLDKISQFLMSSAASKQAEVFTTRELADKLQVSVKTIQNWRDQRLIEYSQVRNKIFYTAKAVDDFLANHSIKRFRNELTTHKVK